MKTQLIALVLGAIAVTAHAAPRDTATAYGQQVQANAAGRVIELTPATRFVNVTNGETVTFEKGTQRFTWHVDVYSNVTEFALARIAPEALHAAGVDVYVAPNERYRD